MPSLLDQLKKVQTQKAQLGPTGQTQQTAQELRTRLTGRVSDPLSAPVTVAEDEEVIRAEQEALAQQQQLAGEYQVAQQTQQEQNLQQQTELQRQDFQNKVQATLYQFNNQATEIANRLRRSKQQIRTEKDMVDLAILGKMQGLQNKKYIDALELEGQRRRLDNDLQFKQELQKTIYGDMMNILNKDIEFRKAMDADDEKFARQMAKMDIETARQLVKEEIKANNEKARYEGLSSIVSGGLSAAEKIDFKSTDKSDTASATKPTT